MPPSLRTIITFSYNVVNIWVSTAEISRSIRALKGKNSVPSRGTSPKPSHAKRRKPGKRLFTSSANGRGERLTQGGHVRLTLSRRTGSGRPRSPSMLYDFFYSDPGSLAQFAAFRDYVNLRRHGSRLPDPVKQNTG